MSSFRRALSGRRFTDAWSEAVRIAQNYAVLTVTPPMILVDHTSRTIVYSRGSVKRVT